MRQKRDAAIAEWRGLAGLTEHPQDELAWIAAVRREAIALLEILVLEESGIRDGDGFWSGSDPVEGTIQTIAQLGSVRGSYRNEPAPF